MTDKSDKGQGIPEASDADLEAVRHLKEAHAQIRGELAKAIVGQDKVDVGT